MSISASDILNAFIQRSARDRSSVTLAERSAPNGYVRVYGPSASASDTKSCHILVERTGGAIAVSDDLRGFLPVRARPAPSVPIAQHPDGASSGPAYGRFGYVLDLAGVQTAEQAVDVLMAGLSSAGLAW
jgi:hypothetical protein